MAIWRLRPSWDGALPTQKKLSILREKMNAIATVETVEIGLERTPMPETTIVGCLFAPRRNEAVGRCRCVLKQTMAILPLSLTLLSTRCSQNLGPAFLDMPRGDGFVDYATFEKGYQALKRSTDAFAKVTAATVAAAVEAAPVAFIVFRAILGFTPPEWAYVTTEMSGRRSRSGGGAVDRPQDAHSPAHVASP